MENHKNKIYRTYYVPKVLSELLREEAYLTRISQSEIVARLLRDHYRKKIVKNAKP